MDYLEEKIDKDLKKIRSDVNEIRHKMRQNYKN